MPIEIGIEISPLYSVDWVERGCGGNEDSAGYGIEELDFDSDPD